MKICCVDCDYFLPSSALQGGRGGSCRKDAARANLVPDGRGGVAVIGFWPAVGVDGNDWCGAGAPRSGDAPKPLNKSAITN